ncbi:MAG: hypothetical protein SF029_09260 [bacterium]|nr:hypothetical protein [bacterium]
MKRRKQDKPGEVVQSFSAELALKLRELRYVVERLQHNSTEQSRSAVLFTTFSGGAEQNTTLEAFSDSLLTHLAEASQLLFTGAS